MFKHTIFVTLLIAVLAYVNCEDAAIELTDVQANIVDTNPAAIATLTQLRVKESKSPDAAPVYTYKCTVGNNPTSRLACTAHDSTSWAAPHDVELKLRCPRSGSGLTLSYVEVIYSVSSPNVNCRVHEGAVGLGYIGVTVTAANTVFFNYDAKFTSY